MTTDGRTADSGFALKAAIAVGIALALISLLAMLWLALDVLLVGFAGILVAVVLRGLAGLLTKHTPIKGGWSVLAVVVVLVALLVAVAWFAAAPVMTQVDALRKILPQTAQHVERRLQSYQWGAWLAQQASSMDWMSRRMNMLGKMTGALSSAFGALADLVIVAFLGLYLALQPRTYLHGLVRLFPVARRRRMTEVFHEIGRVLRWWMAGKAVAMSVIGVLSWLGLWLLGIPLALVLGLLAGLLTFVPFFGAIVSSIPALAMAMTKGPEYLLYVGALYLGLHVVEGYFLNPLIQQRAVSIPPALLLFSQVLLALLVGPMGVVLAESIAAVVLAAVKMLYVEDVLGDTTTNGPTKGATAG